MTWFGSTQRQLDLAALTMAGQAATTSAEALGRIDRHEEDCTKYRETMRKELADHRREVGQRLDEQDRDRTRMHSENGVKFERLFRALYIAIGVGMAISAILSPVGLQLVKLVHP